MSRFQVFVILQMSKGIAYSSIDLLEVSCESENGFRRMFEVRMLVELHNEVFLSFPAIDGNWVEMAETFSESKPSILEALVGAFTEINECLFEGLKVPSRLVEALEDVVSLEDQSPFYDPIKEILEVNREIF